MNRPKDEGLNGNEKIEQAVYAWPTPSPSSGGA